MEKQRLYEVICRQQRRKDECPLVVQKGWHCVECSYAGYIPRKISNKEEIKEEIKEEKQNGEG